MKVNGETYLNDEVRIDIDYSWKEKIARKEEEDIDEYILRQKKYGSDVIGKFYAYRCLAGIFEENHVYVDFILAMFRRGERERDRFSMSKTLWRAYLEIEMLKKRLLTCGVYLEYEFVCIDDYTPIFKIKLKGVDEMDEDELYKSGIYYPTEFFKRGVIKELEDLAKQS